MRRILLCGLAAIGLLPGPAAFAQQGICAPTATQLGVSRVIEIDTASGPRFGGKKKDYEILEDGEVILTFDDGPGRGHTRAVLNALDAHCTKAIFFVVGRMAVADPDMVREYDRRGHTVGSHTWSHAKLPELTPLKARQEIELGFSAVQLAMGKPIAPFFRFPYLAETRSMQLHVQGRHFANFGIDIDSKDYRAHEPEELVHKVISDLAVARKGIILFHDIQAVTARALPQLLNELKAHHYRVVHAIAKDGVETDHRFDAIAMGALARKRVASSHDPMAKRAVTWPVSEPTPPSKSEPIPAPAEIDPPVKTRPPPPTKTGLPLVDWLADVFR